MARTKTPNDIFRYCLPILISVRAIQSIRINYWFMLAGWFSDRKTDDVGGRELDKLLVGYCVSSCGCARCVLIMDHNGVSVAQWPTRWPRNPRLARFIRVALINIFEWQMKQTNPSIHSSIASHFLFLFFFSSF